MRDDATNFRRERIEKLLNELRYEVERGMLEHEIDEGDYPGLDKGSLPVLRAPLSGVQSPQGEASPCPGAISSQSCLPWRL